MESPQLHVFMGKMPLQRSWFQSLVFIPFPWSRLRSALAGLGHTYFLVGLIVCVTIAYPIESARGNPTADDILKALPISDSKKRQVLNGQVVRWTTQESNNREIAVGIVMLMKANPENAAQLFRGAEGYQLIDAVTAHGVIPGKGTTADFANLILKPNGEKEATRYLDAKPGSALNLDSQEMAAFQTLKAQLKDNDGKQQAVETLIREHFLARLHAYQAKGLDGINPYSRSRNQKRLASKKIRLSVTANNITASLYPKFHEALVNYPKADMTGVEESFFWLNIEVFSRPLLVLVHRMLYQEGQTYLVSDRHFYTSHEYNSLQAVGGVWPKDEGALIVYLYRVSTDQVGGFGSSVKRPAARLLMGPYVEELFEKIRAQ